MSEIDLSRSYPEAEPVRGAPPLGRINGFGLGMYGVRDADPEQGLYVKTLCFCLLFVPVFALRSYVVANAGNGGWYFIARVPTSILAKLMNTLVISLVLLSVASISWGVYTGSPGYQAKQHLADGRDADSRDAFAEAAGHFQSAAESGTEHASQGQRLLREVIERAGKEAPAAELNLVLQQTLYYVQGRSDFDDLDYVDLAVKAVSLRSDESPSDLLALLDTVQPMVTETQRQRWFNARVGPLERLVNAEPGNIDALSELAAAYQSQGHNGKARELLMPAIDQLGNSEGARVLGQLLAAEGDLERARQLLEPYVASRITELLDAEQAWDDAYQAAYDAAIADLQNGAESDGWYARYDNATTQEQDEMVSAYTQPRTDGDPTVAAARERYLSTSGVVDVALDLAVLQLELAQTKTDPAERRAALEQAEQTFLSVQSSAGEGFQYRLYLGQVYFWLGRPEQGQLLFDDLLAEAPGDSSVMVSVAYTLRLVGEASKAIDLYEKAYNNETDPQAKYSIASSLAAMARDRPERLKWLQLTSPEDKDAQASLKSAQGQEAAEAGDDRQAASYYNEAIAIYDQMSESSTVLNNSALVLLSQFSLTGETSYRDEALNRLVKAIEYEPSDTVLLRNTASVYMSAAMHDLIAPHLDLKALESTGGFSMLMYLTHDQADWKRISGQMKVSPQYAKAMSMYQRAVLLAPKDSTGYAILAGHYAYLEDEKALSALLDQARKADPDTTKGERSLRASLAGEYDKTTRTSLVTTEKSLRSVLNKSGINQPTRATAGAMLCQVLLARHALGDPVDADQAVRLAEDAWKTDPSSGARSALRDALSFCALKRLSADHASLRKLWEQLGPTHDTFTLLAIAAGADPAVRAAISADADVQRILELRIDQRERFPDGSSLSTWALCRHIAPDQARIEAKRIAEDHPVDALGIAISLELYPYDADSVWEAGWLHMLEGRPEEGRKLIDQYNALGLD